MIDHGAIGDWHGPMKNGQGYLLVVEDDPDILNLLDTTLTFRDYRVITARNGREALDAVQRERPTLVIADIMMPSLDGFGLVHRLRINPETRNIPVVFITATYVSPEDREFALNVGATRFIQKPVDLEKFLATIEDLLNQGIPVAPEPLTELNFYEEYRRRLEAKLDQKTAQIARDTHLIRTHPEEEKLSIEASLRQALREREDLALLLDEVREQLKRNTKAQ